MGYKITDENVDDMIDAAGYGMTYWATSASAEDWEAAGPDAVLVFREAGDGDRDKVHAVTAKQVRKAFRALAKPDQGYVGRTVHGYFVSAVRDRDEDGIDTGHIDSDAGDALVQVAVFGEVIYG